MNRCFFSSFIPFVYIYEYELYMFHFFVDSYISSHKLLLFKQKCVNKCLNNFLFCSKAGIFSSFKNGRCPSHKINTDDTKMVQTSTFFPSLWMKFFKITWNFMSSKNFTFPWIETRFYFILHSLLFCESFQTHLMIYYTRILLFIKFEQQKSIFTREHKYHKCYVWKAVTVSQLIENQNRKRK